MLNPWCKKQKGFTLIELLIVVAIIGILAAIAIPQFATYRQKAFNAAALSDIKNLLKSQEGMMSDWQTYGLTTNTGAVVAAFGNGVILQGGSGPNNGLAGLQAFFQISFSQGVEIVANANASGSTFVLLSKHIRGSRIYGVDRDRSGAYFLTSTPGLTLTASGVNVVPVPFTLEFLVGAGWLPL